MVTLDNVKYNLNSPSAFVYYASMITAVSRANVDRVIHWGLGSRKFNSY